MLPSGQETAMLSYGLHIKPPLWLPLQVEII